MTATKEKPWFCDQPIPHSRAESKAMKAAKRAGGEAWPMVSDALGCDPSQVDEFNQEVRKLGFTDIHYERNGDCSVGSQRSFNRYSQKRGFFHKGEGYHC